MTSRRILAPVLVFALLLALPGVAFGFMGRVKKAAGVVPDEVVSLGSAELCPQLAQFAGSSLDPFREKGLEYTKFNIPQVDAFTLQVASLDGTLTFAQSLLDGFTKELQSGSFDPAAMTERVGLLSKVMGDVVSQAQGAVGTGQNLLGNLPSIVAGPNAMKLKGITNSVKKSLERITTLPERAKGLIAGLADLSAKLADPALLEQAAAAAGGLADVATGAVDAAAAAADGALEAAGGAVDAAVEAAGEAAGAAGGAVDAAVEAAGEAAGAVGEAVDAAVEAAGEAAGAAGEAAGEAVDAAVEAAGEAAGEAVEKAAP